MQLYKYNELQGVAMQSVILPIRLSMHCTVRAVASMVSVFSHVSLDPKRE